MSEKLRVGLYPTCLVDAMRPAIGFAAAKLLEDAHCLVEVPDAPTCCGQPAYNSGDDKTARALAQRVIETCEGFDYLVLPSGSCAAMIKIHYPQLFAGDVWEARAKALSAKTFELISFLTDVLKIDKVTARFPASVTYHDSCSGLRELGIKDQPRKLLASVDGLSIKEMKGAEECCGFGGTFCVKYPDISERIVSEKADNVANASADMLLAGDLGCLLNIAGRLSRQKIPVHVRHVAEVLAGFDDEPPIGEGG